jgi:hypothetical protein
VSGGHHYFLYLIITWYRQIIKNPVTLSSIRFGFLRNLFDLLELLQWLKWQNPVIWRIGVERHCMSSDLTWTSFKTCTRVSKYKLIDEKYNQEVIHVVYIFWKVTVCLFATCRRVGVRVEMANMLNASWCIACLMCSNSVLWCSPNRLAFRICTALLNTAWMHTGILNCLKIVYTASEMHVLCVQQLCSLTYMPIVQILHWLYSLKII